MEESNRIKLLQIVFRETYKKCEGQNDDRLLFRNMVKQLADATREFESLFIKSPLLKIAFSEQYDKRFEEIKELEQSLIDRRMI